MKVKLCSLLFLLFYILFATTGCTKMNSPLLRADSGKLDLSGHDFKAGGTVSLDGKWTCYRSRLFTPEDLKNDVAAKPEFTLVPEDTQTKAPSTYRLSINLPASDNMLGIYISTFRSAYRIWINGKLICSNGEVENDNGKYPIGKENIIDFFENKTGIADIVIQASRFSTSDIQIGEKPDILNIQFLEYLINLPIVFIVIFMGFYHFLLFILRRKEKAFLYTGIFCFAAALYIATLRPDPVIYHLFPAMNYNQYYLCHLFSIFIEELFFIIFLNALFPREIKKWLVMTSAGAFLVLALPLLLIYFLNGWSYIQFVKNTNNYLLYTFSAYIIYKLITVKQKSTDYLIVLTPFILLSISNLFISSNSYLVKLGWLSFVLFLTFSLTLTFTRSFSRVEQLSERLLNLNSLKDDFLVNTAHELKTPLHGVIGLAESMLDSIQGKKSIDSLSLIITSARRLTGLVDNILTFSKMKNKEFSLNQKSINMWQVVNIVFAVLKPLANEKNIQLKNNISEQLPNVYADENSLFQILYNIAGNGIKFTESGEVIATTEINGDKLETAITDTGIGIQSDRLETIFMPFEQIGTYENASDSGTGLGLGITRKLVELNGGSIRVESELLNGSKFAFTLPLSSNSPQNVKADPLSVYASKEECSAVAEINENYGYFKDRPVIFIADDDPINLRLLSNMLVKEKYNIVKFRSGFELIEFIPENKKPDLVIVDVMMPRMSGYDVCCKLRELYALHDLPILLLTIKNQPADIAAGFEAGANDYLPKPLNEKELFARVKNLLDLKNALADAVTAELNFLQAQIKPHFLHNTISAVMSLVRTDPEMARNLLMELSNYLRASFRYTGLESLTPLEDELGIIKSFLYIMSARFPGKIHVDYDINCRMDMSVPHLILQPIVENAVRHGVLEKAGNGSIKISVQNEGDGLSICVSDDGKGIEKELIPLLLNGKVKGAGIGIINVHKRLLTLYGCGLRIESEPGLGTNVYLKLPVKENVEHESYSGR